jgi:uncharacterized protein
MAHQADNTFLPIDGIERFRFRCHRGVSCFTECCRQLDLALSPYDVLRLKQAKKLHSGRFLEQYVIIEWEEGALFPGCYLTMVDDGRASCVFVDQQGCQVYPDRPAACRAYPVGRGASRQADGSVTQQYLLIKEPHCKGFAEAGEQNTQDYFTDQGLAEYNRFNDALTELVHHPAVSAGFRPNRVQAEQYLLALYNLDSFRGELADGRVSLCRPLTPTELSGVAGDDRELLLLAIRWLLQEFFGT